MNGACKGEIAPLGPRRGPGRVAYPPAILAHLRAILAHPPAMLAVCPAILAMLLGWGMGGCAGQKLAASGGGFAEEDAAAVSAVVAQTRAQFPKLSATGIKYISRRPPKDSRKQSVQLVLKGAGAGISPGIQVAARVPMEFELYLGKPRYDRGYARLSIGGGEQETWRIVTHDHRGQAAGEFEFIYLLASARGELWYFAVIGGEFEQAGEKFRGMEGTLIVPGKDGQIGKWNRAYKIDFGSRMPVVPVYQRMVGEAVQRFKSLRRRLPKLKIQRKRIVRSQAQLDLLLNVPDARRAASGKGGNLAAAKEKARLDELRAALTRQATLAGRELTEYFQLRERIAGGYAEFVRGNAYSWASRGRQQWYYDAWKEVELHHPEIDGITARVLAYLPEPEAVKRARSRAMAAVRRHGNWGKDPFGGAAAKK